LARNATVEEAAPSSSRFSAFLELTKPGIAVFVMITSGVGYFMAVRGRIVPLDLVHTLLGTLLATAGALALNQFIEREPDGIMLRTRSRPIPSGRVTAGEARALGLVLFAGGVTYLAATVGWAPAGLTVLSAVAYTMVYTPLKSRSYLATPAGAIPGAMPVLIGWTAGTGTVSGPGLALFGIMFLWQLPHVLSLGWLLREDYARVGFYLIPPSDEEGWKIGKHLLLYASALVPVSLSPTVLGMTGEIYFWGVLVLSLAMVGLCLPAARKMNDRTARRVFLGTLAYHPLLMALLVLDVIPG
jgi:protoheme IX farnesyltransferase